MKINSFVHEKYFCTEESVKWQITDSISENSTDSDLESISECILFSYFLTNFEFFQKTLSNINNFYHRNDNIKIGNRFHHTE